MVRAATYGEAWCCSPFPLQKEMWEETVGAYRAKARALGKEPFVVLMRDGWVADNFASAARVFGQPYVEDMSYYARQGILDHHPDFQDEAALTPERMRAHAVMGSPQDCIEQLEYYEREFHVDYVVMRMREPTGPSFEATREAIQRFGEEVVSYFHRRDSASQHPAIPLGARW
jgi:alkanesulfonate monooxygenase SsuD/methylene tetrahydromethanopterin reductase-like flavin-dependent oxidoreductase (luciferase family)